MTNCKRMKRVAEQLYKGLTQEERIELIAELLSCVRGRAWTGFLDNLNSELADMIKGFSGREVNENNTIEFKTESDAKFAHEFSVLLDKWRGIISEADDEEGRYCWQERHWEPPCFDGDAFSVDLESCAIKMLPMLGRAADLGLESEKLFDESCAEIQNAIQSLPEYIYSENGVSLGPQTTQCVLKWLNLHAQNTVDFLGRLYLCIEETEYVRLDASNIKRHLLDELDKPRQLDFLQAMESYALTHSEFRDELQYPATLWHELWYQLTIKYAPDKAFEIAEKIFGCDWTKGAYLIDYALSRGDKRKAVTFCQEMIGAYNEQKFGCEFDLQETLMEREYFTLDSHQELIGKVLVTWRNLAEEMGDQSTANLLGIHLAIHTDCNDLSVVRQAFEQAQNAPYLQLLEYWKALILHNTSCVGDDAGFCWQRSLLDSGAVRDYADFVSQSIQWLNEKLEDLPRKEQDRLGFLRPYVAGSRQPPQLVLIGEIMKICPVAKDYPVLMEALNLTQGMNGKSCYSVWLAETDLDALFSAAIEFIRRNLQRLIPSPEDMQSLYDPAITWLRVARELDPKTAQAVLEEWRDKYTRKRNLWRDLSPYGFHKIPEKSNSPIFS